MSVTAIVLAGGASRRYGSDKLAADLDGAPVLARTIEAVAPLADGVLVAGPRLPEGLVGGDVPIALIADEAPFAGPLAALANVLPPVSFGSAELGIVVGGDMPRLVPAVLVAMLDVLDQSPPVDAVVLVAPPASTSPSAGPATPARRQVLPLAIRLEPAARAARAAVESGERSLRAFLDRLVVVELPAHRWLALDPDGATLTDVDTRADLDRLNAD